MPSVIHRRNTCRDCEGYDIELEGCTGFPHELVSGSVSVRG